MLPEPSYNDDISNQRLRDFIEERKRRIALVGATATVPSLSSAVPLGGNQPTPSPSTAVPLGGGQPITGQSTAVPLGGTSSAQPATVPKNPHDPFQRLQISQTPLSVAPTSSRPFPDINIGDNPLLKQTPGRAASVAQGSALKPVDEPPPPPRPVPTIDVGSKTEALPPTDRSLNVRTRYAGPTANVENAALDRIQSFGSSGEPFGSSRPRRTEERNYLEDDLQYARDLERQPRNKVLDFLTGLTHGIASLENNQPKVPWSFSGRERKLNDVYGRLGKEFNVQGEQAKIERMRAEAFDKLQKPPADSTRIVDEGEYPNVPAGTEVRQQWDPSRREYVDVKRNGKPVVSKARPAEKELAPEIKYNQKNEAVLVPKDGGPARPILNEDGTPLSKAANESGNVQTAYRLEPDGITQIQIERDESGKWVDSVGPNGQRIVRANVGRIDPDTGAPMSAIVTAGRLAEQERRESQRKMQAYTQEEQEWAGKETNFRQNKTNEDDAIKAKTAQLQSLYQEKPSAYGGLMGGTRSQDEIDTDVARVKKEIEVHRENAKLFQGEADQAAASATEARRNRSLYSDSGSQGPTPPRAPRRAAKAPAADGKYHYTRAEVEAAAKAQGKDPGAAYKALKARRDVVIDE